MPPRERLQREWYVAHTCKRCGGLRLSFDHLVECGERVVERYVTCLECGYRCRGVFEPPDICDL